MPVFPLPFRQDPATHLLDCELEATVRPTFIFPLKARSRNGWHHPELKPRPWLSHTLATQLSPPEALSLALAVKQPVINAAELTISCSTEGSNHLDYPWPVSHTVHPDCLFTKAQSVQPERLKAHSTSVAVARFTTRERPIQPTRWSAVSHPYPVERLPALPALPTAGVSTGLPLSVSHKATKSAKRAPLVRQSLAVHRLKRLLQAEIKSTLAKRNDTLATNILLHRVYDRISVSLFDRLEVNDHWQLVGHWGAKAAASKDADLQWLVVYRLKDEATTDWKQAMIPAPEDITRTAPRA